MANQITDNRTLVDSADVVGTVWVDLAGAAATLDAEIFIQGAGSMGAYCTTTRDGTFYRYAADQDLSNNHVYIWVNCGIVGLLDTKANGGIGNVDTSLAIAVTKCVEIATTTNAFNARVHRHPVECSGNSQ